MLYDQPLDKEKIDQIFKAFSNQNTTLFNSNSNSCLWDNNDADRSTGRTTRLVDYYIQELYSSPNKEIKILDHYDSIKADIHLTQMILQRLYAEHPRDKFKIINQNTLKYVRT